MSMPTATPIAVPIAAVSSAPRRRGRGIARPIKPPRPPAGGGAASSSPKLDARTIRSVDAHLDDATAAHANAETAAAAAAAAANASPMARGGRPEAKTQPPAPPTGDADEGVDRRRLCEAILQDGFVQSYVDFFYLTHRPDPTLDGLETGDRSTEIVVPPSEMLYIRDKLTAAEQSRRQGETALVYESYSALAQYFQSARDPKTGVYFYEKCLEISRLTGDAPGETAANHDLGLIHQAMGDVPQATAYHERELELAVQQAEAAAGGARRAACAELLKCYRMSAEERETAGEFGAAVACYKRCLESAKVAVDRPAEGLANYKLGRVHILMEEPMRAIAFLDAFLAICKEGPVADVAGEGRACAALALAHRALQDEEQAIVCLEKCLQIAMTTDDLSSQAEACCTLGAMYAAGGDHDRAADFFERNYDITRSIVSSGGGDTGLVDVARLYLGMARANAMMGSYVHVIQHDPKALLLWKNRRTAPAPN